MTADRRLVAAVLVALPLLVCAQSVPPANGARGMSANGEVRWTRDGFVVTYQAGGETRTFLVPPANRVSPSVITTVTADPDWQTFRYAFAVTNAATAAQPIASLQLGMSGSRPLIETPATWTGTQPFYTVLWTAPGSGLPPGLRAEGFRLFPAPPASLS